MRLRTKIEIKNNILAIITLIIAILIPSFIFKKWIEGFVFFICHWLIREQFPKQYHCTSHAVCRIITGIVFFFGISFVLPLSLSLISAIPICYFISWVGFTKKQAIDFERDYNNVCERYCNEKNDLLVACRKAKLNERDTEIAILYFYEKKTPKDIWLWLCESKKYETIEWDSIYHLLWRIKNKLKK